MPLQALSPITDLEDLRGVQIVAKDVNGNVTAAFQPTVTVDQPAAVVIQNFQSKDSINATFTFDVSGRAPSTGPVTITLKGNAVNNDATTAFETQVTITVSIDPSQPGPATHFVVTDGTVVLR